MVFRKKNYYNWVWKRASNSIKKAKANLWNRIENYKKWELNVKTELEREQELGIEIC